MIAVDAGLFRYLPAFGLLVAGALLAWPLAAAEDRWIVDPVTRCGTTSSFSTPGENIRWYGECRDGKLDGKGTLIWYDGQIETERNEGMFREGEFHGDVLTTFPDGRAIYGQYWTGVRHGYFLVVQADRGTLTATYEKGKLKSSTPVSAAEARDWQQRRRQRLLAAAPRPDPIPQQQSTARAEQRTMPVQQAQPARQAQPAAAPSRGFWSRLNPLNWGVVGFFSGLFGGGDVEPETVASTRPQTPKRTAAPVQPVALTAQPSAVAPMITQAVYRPAAAPWASRVYGTSYDMSALLSEPHPFAGGGKPWTPPARPLLTGYQPVPTAATPQAPASWRGLRLVSRAAPQAYLTPRILPAQAADELFMRGYGLESAGDPASAATVYEQVIRRYPATRSANHAGARLGLVRATAAPARRFAAATPSTAPAGTPSGARIVVATNSPFPQAAAASNLIGSRALSMFTNSPWLQQNVCSRKGLYTNDTRWCGRVLRDDGRHLLVEIQNVRLFGFGTIGISRSTCTGGTLLTWFSRGTTIRVPKQCLAAAG